MKQILITATQKAELPTFETFGKGEHRYRIANGIREIDNEIVLSVFMDDDVSDFNMLAGTALKRLFKWINVQKKINIKGGIMASLPIDLSFTVVNGEGEDVLFDTATAGLTHKRLFKTVEKIRNRLKVGSSSRSKRNFAEAFMELFSFATSPMELAHINELIATFEADIEAEGEARKYNKWLESNCPN